LADRFAETFAEYLHEKIVEIWGYASDEKVTTEAMIERGLKFVLHQVIGLSRPFRKTDLEVLNVEQEIGVTLTEEIWMWPFFGFWILLGIRKSSILDLENKRRPSY
jgi:5-methyltetrahydrofolate--homocysteine methyltransferase